MDELEEIRQRKLAEMQQQQAELVQQIQALENLVKPKMTKEALQRYGNLKSAHPDRAVQLLAVLGQAVQQGQVQQIDDTVMKELLVKLTPQRREFKFTRK